MIVVEHPGTAKIDGSLDATPLLIGAADKPSLGIGGTARWSGISIAVGSPADFLGS